MNSNIPQNPYLEDVSNFVPIILVLFVIISFFVISVLIARYFARKKNEKKGLFKNVVLLVRVPREKPKNDDQADGQKGKEQEPLARSEILFSVLGGVKAQRGLKHWWFGRNDDFALEIVADKNGTISFYVVAPQYLQNYFEQQIQAQYPEAQISVEKDYNIFSTQSIVLTATLRLKRSFVLPIKTYRKLDSDPMNALTQAISKLVRGDGAAIQIVARSASPSWHRYGKKIATEIQQGKSFANALRSVEGDILLKILGKIFNFFLDLLSTKKGDEKIKDKEGREEKERKLSPMEEEVVKAIEEKSSKAGLEINLRIVVSASNKNQASIYLDQIFNAFNQYSSYEYGNGFQLESRQSNKKTINNFIYRRFDQSEKIILNSEELASIFHFSLETTKTPNIRWLTAKQAAPPQELPDNGLLLGKSVYRGQEKQVYIKNDDRRRHIYSIGKSGTGKSTLLENMVRQDIQSGKGVAVIDPHGDLVNDTLKHIPRDRIDDVILFDPANLERPMGLNLLEYDPKYPEQKTFVVNEMIKIFDKLYDLKSTGGPMFEQYMRNAMLLVMADPNSGSTLLEISRVLADSDFRDYKLKHCSDPTVVDFWTKEAEKAGGEAALANMVPYITSKLNTFISNDLMRPIISQQTSSFNLREVMDQKKILLVNLSKGRLGDMNSSLIGMIIVGKVLMSALSRVDIPHNERNDFYLYIDEFQNFTTDSINVILSEARKYKLNLTIAHQYLGQLIKANDTSIKDAVLGNVGTIISFGIGVEDAQSFAKQFEPVFNEYDVINIEKFNAYVKLLIDNTVSRAFNIKTLPPDPGDEQIASMVRSSSSLKYGRDKREVEMGIIDRINRTKTSEVQADPMEEIENLR